MLYILSHIILCLLTGEFHPAVTDFFLYLYFIYCCILCFNILFFCVVSLCWLQSHLYNASLKVNLQTNIFLYCCLFLSTLRLMDIDPLWPVSKTKHHTFFQSVRSSGAVFDLVLAVNSMMSIQ